MESKIYVQKSIKNNTEYSYILINLHISKPLSYQLPNPFILHVEVGYVGNVSPRCYGMQRSKKPLQKLTGKSQHIQNRI